MRTYEDKKYFKENIGNKEFVDFVQYLNKNNLTLHDVKILVELTNKLESLGVIQK